MHRSRNMFKQKTEILLSGGLRLILPPLLLILPPRPPLTRLDTTMATHPLRPPTHYDHCVHCDDQWAQHENQQSR